MQRNLAIAIRYFKRKKVQVISLCLIIIATIVMLSTSIILIGAYESGEKLFERLNAADSVMVTNADKNIVNDFINFSNTNEFVKDIFYEDAYVPNGSIVLEKNDSSVLMIFQPFNDLEYNKIEVLKGEDKNKPNGNEIFLPTGFAKTYGIELGDKVVFYEEGKKIELEVTALVLDAHFSSGAFQPSVAYIADELFSSFTPNTTKISIKFKDYNKALELDYIKSIDEYTNNTPIGLYIDHETLLMGYSGFSTIMSAVMVVVGFILLLISLIVISNSISSSINEEYKNIGVLKAFGYKNSKVINIYILRYLFISLISIPFAFIVSSFVGKLITNNLAETYGNINQSVAGITPTLVSSIIITIIIVLFTTLISLKTIKIKPVIAIKYGRALEKPRKSFFNILKSFFPLILTISIKEIIMNKRKSFSMFLMLGLASFMIMVCLITNTTFSNEKTIKELMGVGNFDLQISKQEGANNLSTNEIINRLEELDDIENAYSVTMLTNSSRYDKELDRTTFFIGSSYSDFNKADYQFIKGDSPDKENEVAITYKVSQIYEVEIGDKFTFNLEGENKEFSITGIYQTVSNMGIGFLVTDKSLPYDDYTSISFIKNVYIKLKKDTDKENVKEIIKTELGDNIKIENENTIIDLFSSVGNGVTSTINLMIIILLSLISIVVFNIVVVQVRNSSKKIGLYKAIGYSVNQVRKIFVYRNLVIAIIAITLGTIFGINFAGTLVTLLLRGTVGIYKLPMSTPIIPIIIVNIIFLLIVFISAWISTYRIKNITPRILLTE